MANAAQPYGGMLSDNAFQTAYMRSVASGNVLGSWYDPSVTSHYPPLFFWINGLLMHLTGWTAIQMEIIWPAVVIFVLPFVIFQLAKYFPQSAFDSDKVALVAMFFLLGLGSFTSAYLITRQSIFGIFFWIGMKPHETVAALLGVGWVILGSGFLSQEVLDWKKGVWLGALGGIIFLIYYPIFLVGLGADTVFALFALRHLSLLNRLQKIMILGIVGLTVGSIWWFPYLRDTFLYRGENYSLRYFELVEMDPSRYTYGLGFLGLPFFLGLWGIYVTRANKSTQALMSLLCMTYLWALGTFVTYPLFRFSLIGWRAQMILLPVFSLMAAVGFMDISHRVLKDRISVYLVPFVALLFIPTSLQWNKFTDGDISSALSPIPPSVTGMSQALENRQSVLLGGTAEANFYLPAINDVQYYIAPSIWFSSPFSQYRDRVKIVEEWAQISDPHEFYMRVKQSGVQGLVFDKKQGEITVGLAVPARWGRDQWEWVSFNRTQFSSEFFDILYEDDKSILLWVR